MIKGGHEFGSEQGGVMGELWKEEKEGINDMIVL